MSLDNFNGDGSNRHEISRRAVMKALLAGGVIGATAGGASADTGVGGGRMADEAADLLARVYEGSWSDRPSAGVAGRYYHVKSGTNAGTLYEDDGSSWNKVDLGVGALNAESIQDSADGQAWETLRETGYQTGDILHLSSFSTNGVRANTTSDSSYGGAANLVGQQLRWDRIVPDVSPMVVAQSGVLAPGTDETLSVIVEDALSGDTVVSAITASGGSSRIFSQWENYDPSKPSDVRKIRTALKTDPGNNASTVRDHALHIGIKI